MSNVNKIGMAFMLAAIYSRVVLTEMSIDAGPLYGFLRFFTLIAVILGGYALMYQGGE